MGVAEPEVVEVWRSPNRRLCVLRRSPNRRLRGCGGRDVAEPQRGGVWLCRTARWPCRAVPNRKMNVLGGAETQAPCPSGPRSTISMRLGAGDGGQRAVRRRWAGGRTSKVRFGVTGVAGAPGRCGSAPMDPSEHQEGAVRRHRIRRRTSNVRFGGQPHPTQPRPTQPRPTPPSPTPPPSAPTPAWRRAVAPACENRGSRVRRAPRPAEGLVNYPWNPWAIAHFRLTTPGDTRVIPCMQFS